MIWISKVDPAVCIDRGFGKGDLDGWYGRVRIDGGEYYDGR